jgi:hypothetical protein
MPSTPAILRYLITFAALFIVLTQVAGASLAQKAMFVVLTIFCTEWLFYFIPYLKRGPKL